jgi:hypothetical protein
MSDSQDPFPSNSRSFINAMRRSTAITQLCLLVPMGLFMWWLAAHGEGGLVFLPILAHAMFSAALHKREICLSCERCVSMLPNEGHMRLPELSRSVRVCPFCGADFSLPSPEPSKEPAAAASQP